MTTTEESTPVEKIMLVIGVVGTVLIVGFFVASYRSTRVPSRPKGVSSDAVFLWAPAVGLPAPRRGSWLSCSEQSGRDYCSLADIHGTLRYKGEFVRYGDRGFVPSDQLRINVQKTGDDAVWVGDTLVYLVALQNGDVLIPASKYEEGAGLITQHRSGTTNR